MADDAGVWAITGDATGGHGALQFSEWTGAELTYNNCPGDSCAFWLYVTEGVVEQMVDQYRP